MQAPPPALQEQPFPRNSQHPRGFLDAPVGAVKCALHHGLFENLHGLRQRLINAHADSYRVGGTSTPRSFHAPGAAALRPQHVEEDPLILNPIGQDSSENSIDIESLLVDVTREYREDGPHSSADALRTL
jgi:hypothetical protein